MNLRKRNIVFITISSLILIGVAFCFFIAFNNYKNKQNGVSSTSETAKDISNKYEITNLSNEDYTGEVITKGGNYIISGESNPIRIDTDEEVIITLKDASITSSNEPAIYVINSKSTTIILEGENTIVSSTTEELDGAIYSCDDLVFKGDGTINITSNIDGIVSKDTLVINNGTYNIVSEDDAIRGKDYVAIVDGIFNINSKGDAIKSSNDTDSELGYVIIDGGTFNIKTIKGGISDSKKGIKAETSVIINGGTFKIDSVDDGIHSNDQVIINKGDITITSSDDAVHADGYVEINDGSFDIEAHEGIEATYVKINGGTVNIYASDDGINAGNKSNNYKTLVEINGGYITISMGQGDTDGVDSNGDIIINGGTISVTGQSTFDYDGSAKLNGGTVIVNGEETKTITNQFMGNTGNMGPGGRMR